MMNIDYLLPQREEYHGAGCLICTAGKNERIFQESAVDCLYLHPLVSSYSLAKDLVEKYIELNKDFTGEWK